MGHNGGNTTSYTLFAHETGTTRIDCGIRRPISAYVGSHVAVVADKSYGSFELPSNTRGDEEAII